MNLKVGIVCERMLLGFGADLVYHKLAEGLQKRGCRVTVFTCQSDGTYENYGYKITHMPIAANADFQQYERDASRYAHFLLTENLDLVILGTFPFYSYAPFLSKHVPCIAIDHGICCTKGMAAALRNSFELMKKTQYDEYFNHVNKIITVSQFIKSTVPDIHKNKTAVVYNGIDHYPKTIITKKIKEFRSNHGISDNDILLLYIGRLNPKGQPYKGTTQLKDIFKSLNKKYPNIKMVMAGYGNSDDEVDIRSYGIIPVINAPMDLMPTLFSASDIYVTATSWEGFDLPLVEAQYFGKPGVALRIGAHPEVVKDGETSFLADDIPDMTKKLELLICEKETRIKMGEKAAEWANNFQWDDVVDQYAKIIEETMHAQKKGNSRKIENKVSAIVLNYNADFEILEECVQSIRDQSYKNMEIIIVDNNSTNGSLEFIQNKFDGLKIVKLNDNFGFSIGINRGVEAATGEFMLILNFDIKLDPRALEELVNEMRKDSKTIAVAPKMLFYHHPDYIESLGNILDPSFSAFNMGIGQPDIGQYDVNEEVFGVCFGAALIRTQGFCDDVVGKLDERFFMYYEDIDWNYRANALGYKIMTAPKAKIYHHHSAATRKFSYEMKYELIQLNLLRTILQNMQGRSVVFIELAKRFKEHLLGIARNSYRRSTLKIIFKFLIDVPVCLKKRSDFKKRRIVDDHDIIKYCWGEQPFYDPVNYSPVYSLDALEFVYFRKNIVDGNPKYRDLLQFISSIKISKFMHNKEFVKENIELLLKDEPEKIKDYIRKF